MTIKRRDFTKMLGAAALTPAFIAKTHAQSTWSFEANVAECCSCEIPCPCNFGLPTKMQCDGNRLIEIYKGHSADTNLAGIRFLVTFEMGQWTRIFLDNAMTEAQMAAAHDILPLGFAGFHGQAQTIKSVPMTVERSDDLVIKYTTPESRVEMEPLRGIDGGLITVDGLPNIAFYDYVQYQSVVHIHDGPQNNWSHKGTNGFTSRMIASG